MPGLSDRQQGLLMLFAFLIPAITGLSAWAALGMPTDREALGILLSGILGNLAAALIAYSKEVAGGTGPTSTSATSGQPPVMTRLMNRFNSFFMEFLTDTQARSPRRKGKYYDPDPKRRSHRGHRKGIEPAGLKRWRLSHRRTHDPGRASSLWKGPRGGHYFRGPRKNRYDPAPARRRRFTGARRVGGKIEGIFNRYGTMIGAALGLGIGVYQGYNDYATAYGKSAAEDYLHSIIGGDIKDTNGTVTSTRMPEIAHLWTTETGSDATPPTGFTPLTWLKYKFTGIDKDGTNKGSAWVTPFWIGLAATLAAPIARMFTSKGQRFLRPLHKIGVGMLTVSTIGALALPGSPKKGVVNMMQTRPGFYQAPPVPTNQLTYTG